MAGTELYRQSIHSVLGLIFIAVIGAFGVTAGFGLAITFIVIALIVAVAVKHNHDMGILRSVFGFFEKIIAKVERNSEKTWPGQGALMFLLGVCITIVFFPQKELIIPAILVLSFGDGASTIFGEKFGKTKVKGNRTLEGTIAGIAIASFVLLPIFPFRQALGIALIGMMAEYLPLNDNITVPICTALAVVLL
ncbi:MAG: hypothetical protein Q7K42_05820 [Candidatus Diapherotrites archaeon]|nr:hypothetical protein [Candidatus Diapherotrites archaeon]